MIAATTHTIAGRSRNPIRNRWAKIIASVVLITVVIFIPFGRRAFPIRNSYHIDSLSFWYYPWGISEVHKGIDIFTDSAASVYSPVSGIVWEQGYGTLGGNYIYILGPGLRTYYFAHLSAVYAHRYQWVSKNQIIGAVGNTGNAIGKPFHLHYSIHSPLPLLGHYNEREYKATEKLFYLDPLSDNTP
ncbi:MAG: nlpD [Bacteroidota bacterium]|nr:nlpD [Bacteroidota bacterium]